MLVNRNPFSFTKRKLVILFCACVFLIVLHQLVIVSSLKDTGTNSDAVIVCNLTNYVSEYEAHLRDHPYWDENCTAKYGIKMIRDWRLTKTDLCTKRSKSRISFYTRYNDNFNRRLYLLMNTKVKMYPPFYEGNASSNNVSIRDDIISASCELARLNYTGRDNEKDLLETGSLIKVDTFEPSIEADLDCEVNVTHTVFWMWRWDTTNVFHFMEDMVNTFVSLILLDEDPNKVEIVIYDGVANEKNPLFTLWSHLFPRGVRIIQNDPFPRNTCFTRSIIGMYGIRSHFTEYGAYRADTYCSSPILKAFRDWVTEKLEIKEEISVKKPKLLFISRHQYLPTRSITRVIQNEDTVLAAIKKSYPSFDIVVFQPEKYSTLKEQIEIARQGCILVGVHGAGMLYSMFMSRGSHLIEIFMDDRGATNRHYHNIASWMELQYHSIEVQGKSVPPKDIIRVIDTAVNTLKFS